ncbi:MAG TPA: ferredoxin-thioredoxin reductase catalytic domain-containing protein [Coriobacteriia bacterium]
MTPDEARLIRRVLPAGTTVDDLKAYMEPFAAHLGYKLNTETEFVHDVLESELLLLERDGDVYCPCRMRTGDPKEDLKIVCPCIPFYADQFAAMQKCWCGLFIRTDVQDGAELIGVIDEPHPGTLIDVPVARFDDIAPGGVRHIKIGKRDIAVVRVEDEVFALSNLCRHAFGPLSDGFTDGYILTCPWHGWNYDVRTGTTDHPDAHVSTYPAFVRDGEVLVTVALGRSR